MGDVREWCLEEVLLDALPAFDLRAVDLRWLR